MPISSLEAASVRYVQDGRTITTEHKKDLVNRVFVGAIGVAMWGLGVILEKAPNGLVNVAGSWIKAGGASLLGGVPFEIAAENSPSSAPSSAPLNLPPAELPTSLSTMASIMKYDPSEDFHRRLMSKL